MKLYTKYYIKTHQKHIQQIIDAAWRNPKTEEFRHRLFPEGKPSVGTFIERLAKEVSAKNN